MKDVIRSDIMYDLIKLKDGQNNIYNVFHILKVFVFYIYFPTSYNIYIRYSRPEWYLCQTYQICATTLLWNQ